MMVMMWIRLRLRLVRQIHGWCQCRRILASAGAAIVRKVGLRRRIRILAGGCSPLQHLGWRNQRLSDCGKSRKTLYGQRLCRQRTEQG